MKLSEVYTPAVLLDLDILERNIGRFAAEAAAHGKQLWPMLKTHKSLELAALQAAAGATGFSAAPWTRWRPWRQRATAI